MTNNNLSSTSNVSNETKPEGKPADLPAGGTPVESPKPAEQSPKKDA